MTENEKVVGRALSAVNHIRLMNSLGPPLEHMPKGPRMESDKCPIAQCLPDAIVGLTAIHAPWAPLQEYGEGDMDYFMDTPHPIRDFIRMFDDGRLPELIDP